MRLKELIAELNKQRPSIEIDDMVVKRLWIHIAERLMPHKHIALITFDKDSLYKRINAKDIVKYVRKVGQYYFVVFDSEEKRTNFEEKYWREISIDEDDNGNSYMYESKE